MFAVSTKDWDAGRLLLILALVETKVAAKSCVPLWGAVKCEVALW